MSCEEHFDREKAIKAQEEYCEKAGVPQFAPKDGFCPRCMNQIYGVGGVSVEEASTRMVTGCPFCRYSFVG